MLRCGIDDCSQCPYPVCKDARCEDIDDFYSPDIGVEDISEAEFMARWEMEDDDRW